MFLIDPGADPIYWVCRQAHCPGARPGQKFEKGVGIRVGTRDFLGQSWVGKTVLGVGDRGYHTHDIQYFSTQNTHSKRNFFTVFIEEYLFGEFVQVSSRWSSLERDPASECFWRCWSLGSTWKWTLWCDLARKSNTNSSMYLRCILNRRTAGASVHEDSLLTIIV